jgi:hypothetical protein
MQMLDLSSNQRRLLLDKVPDIANLVAAGLVFGHFSPRPVFLFFYAGRRLRRVAVDRAVWLDDVYCEEAEIMAALVFLGMILAFVSVIGIADLLNDRRRRRENPPHS